MRVHHLNCGSMCPVGFKYLGIHPAPHRIVCHVLLIETDEGLVLVDTGFGRDDLASPQARLGLAFLAVSRPTLDPAETAAEQVVRLGFSVNDVRHIIPTHFDLDHIGGLADFPRATVHVFEEELRAFRTRATANEKQRYKSFHLAHDPTIESYATGGDRWFGFDAVRKLRGLPDAILIVPLVGHTRGHSAVVIEGFDGTLVHAGDAYFHRDEMDLERPSCPAVLAAFQSVMAVDNAARIRNQSRLRELRREPGIRVVSSHDPVELASFRN